MDKISESTIDQIDLLLEWVVFGHLNRITNLELILLKGHLLIETILEIVLKRYTDTAVENNSFYRKILILKSIDFQDETRKEFIVLSLKKINRLRNKIAHEFLFDIANKEFEIWALNIFQNLKGEKFSKYTFRSKIIHAFSILTNNMLALKPMDIKK